MVLEKKGRRSSTAIAMTNNDPCPDTVFRNIAIFGKAVVVALVLSVIVYILLLFNKGL